MAAFLGGLLIASALPQIQEFQLLCYDVGQHHPCINIYAKRRHRSLFASDIDHSLAQNTQYVQ